MIRIALALLVLALGPLPVLAQNPFSAAVTVNDRVVTYWEISQRARLLTLLNAPGDPVERAREDLINERLQVAAAERLGVAASPEELEAGMAEFAGRVNLGAEAFIQRLESDGVAGETFRDFVYAGITWRNVLRSQFGARAQVTEEEVDRALALAAIEGGAQVLIAEIIVPLTAENREEARQLMTDLSRSTNGSVDAFSAAARRYSAAQSREAGGSLGYRPLSSLPAQLQSVILPLPPGGVTEPIPLGQAIAIFQLRDFREEGFVSPDAAAVEYVIAPIAGGRTEATLAQAAELRDAVDSCDDLYGVRPGGFERISLPVDDVPAVRLPLR